MGKKNRRSAHHQQQLPQKKKLCAILTDKNMHRIVEDVWEKTSKWSGVSAVAPSQATIWEDYDKLMSLVDHLKKKQGIAGPVITIRASPVPLPPRKRCIGEFKDWLKRNGAVFDKVDIAEFGANGLGLKVIEGIEEAERVLQVPEPLMLSWNGIMKSPLAAFIKSDPLLSAMPNLALAVALLNERYNPDSFWRPYINILPQSFDLPLFYTREELLELTGSPVLVEAICQSRNITRLYAIIYQRLKLHNDPELFISSVGFNYNDFVWAVSCVMSRQNKIPLKGSGEASLVLIPFWDLANHTPGKILTDYDSTISSCVCYSMKRYSPGEEFMIFYGPRPNSDLFLNQGFTYKDNPYDSLKIPVGLSRMEDSSTRQKRQKILDKLKIQVPGQFSVRAGPTPFSPELMAFTRVFTAPSDLLEQWNDLDEGRLREVLMSETLYKRDVKVLEFLENRCSLLLHPYKTTLEKDEVLLSESITDRLKYVVILRASEKRILRNASDLARREREGIVVQLNRIVKGKAVEKHSQIEHETSQIGNEAGRIEDQSSHDENGTSQIENETAQIGIEASGLESNTVMSEQCTEPSVDTESESKSKSIASEGTD